MRLGEKLDAGGRGQLEALVCLAWAAAAGTGTAGRVEAGVTPAIPPTPSALDSQS